MAPTLVASGQPRTAALPSPASTVAPSALAEIKALLDEKATWTPGRRKMDSQLIHAQKKSLGQAFAPGAPNLEMDIKPQRDGRLLVDLRAEITPALLAVIAQGGGQVLSSFPRFDACRALVRPEQLGALAEAEEVAAIRHADEGAANTGSVTSEGDTTHSALAARLAFGVTGAGVKVGVLSDSVDYLDQSQATGDLGPVTVLPGQDGTPARGEGTAMLEIIHDLAPDAALYFATALGGQASFAQNVLDLRGAGCDIIVDDYSYFAESPFQDGVIAQAVNSVTADGALFFSCAQNSGNLDSGTSGTWEGDFVDDGPATWPITETARLHSFGTATYNTVRAVGNWQRVDLFWSDPLGASDNDYDLFILNSTGTTVLRSSINAQTGTQNPYESVSSLNVGERIVVVKSSGQPRFLHLGSGRCQISIPSSGATYGHSAATNSFSVAAVDVATAHPKPFDLGCPVESFSSDGPRRVFYQQDGSPITPGNFSSTGGAVRQKPDVAGADGGVTTVPGFTEFSGTSAAAPHVAAIAALLKSYNPSVSPAQVRAALTSYTLDNMIPGIDRDSGWGIVMAPAALALAPPDALRITPPAGLAASGVAGGPFVNSTQTLVLTTIGAAPFSWSLANTSAWLRLSPTAGTLIPGGPANVVTAALTGAASNLAAGSYSAAVSITNLGTGFVQARQFTLAVTAELGARDLYDRTVMSLNPLGWWRLNERAQVPPPDVVTNYGTLGATADAYGFNSVTQAEPGIVGNAFRFSNPALTVGYFGSHVDVPYQPGLNPNGPFTVEFWVNPAQLTADLFCPICSLDAVENGGSSRLGWLFYQNANDTWEFRLGNSNGYVATLSGGFVQANSWQHVAGVYDGAYASLYLDGQLVAGPMDARSFSPNPGNVLRFGATTIPNRTYDGWVDEPAFYTNALSPAQIAAHHDAAFTNTTGYVAQILAEQPAAYWRFDEAAYTTPDPGTLPIAINSGLLAPVGNGSYQPGTTPGVPGVPNTGFEPPNTACSFGGMAVVDIHGAGFNLPGPLTLSAWVKPNPANGSSQAIVGRGAASYRLVLDGSGFPRFSVGQQPGGELIGSVRIDDNQWHHLVGVYDATNSEMLYVDGQLTSSTSGATTPLVSSYNHLWIGDDPDGGNLHTFNGVVDEVLIFTNSLRAAQVRQLISAASPPVIQRVLRAPGAVQLTWSALPGRNYQVQVNNALNQVSWSNWGAPITAKDSSIASSISTGSETQQFYRILLLP